MKLLDREKELGELAGALCEATNGRGRVVLVSGEAGIGKTSLVRNFLSRIEDEVRVLQGACEDLSVAEPLGPLHDLLQEAAPFLSEELSNAQNHL